MRFLFSVIDTLCFAEMQENILFYILWIYDIMSIATAVPAQAGIMQKIGILNINFL